MTAAKARRKTARKKTPVPRVARRPGSHSANRAGGGTKKPQAKKPQTRARGRKKNPAPRFLVVTGPHNGFVDKEEAVAYAKRYADNYNVSLTVVQK